MTRTFNPYQAWLGLGEHLEAPNHFELLGLDQVEEDPRKIAAAADRAASKVRAVRPGPQAAEWARVLDRIAEAKRCLTNSQLRVEYLASLQTGGGPENAHLRESRSGRRSSRKSTPNQVDPNMFPPGMAPAGAPVSPAESPMAPVVHSQLAPANPAMQAYLPVPGQAASGAPVPYLQPVESPGLPDPMRPVSPATYPGPGSAGLSPMAPLATSRGAGSPLAGIPVAIPLSAPPSPPVAHPAGLPVGPPQPNGLPTNLAPAEPRHMAPMQSVPVAAGEQPVSVNKSSASLLAAQHASTSSIGPIVLGSGIGLALLALAAGIYIWNSQGKRGTGGTQVANTSSLEPAPSVGGPAMTTPPSTTTSSSVGFQQKRESTISSPTGGNRNIEPTPDTRSPLATATTPEPSEPPPLPEPTPTPSPPTPAPPSEPATSTPAKMEDLPQPTTADLAKLGLAFQKARQAIAVHNFDRAAAFLEVAGEMPRLAEHQAMLDRLKLLSDCVEQYRAAIRESLEKLAAGSSFEVGETRVGVVETGPARIIFRVNGQNRSYTLADLPVGLAAALAAQTLDADDPNTLTLKGAFVLASPKATDDEKKKAQEFLEEAAKSVDAAQDLLLLLKDHYNFTDS